MHIYGFQPKTGMGGIAKPENFGEYKLIESRQTSSSLHWAWLFSGKAVHKADYGVLDWYLSALNGQYDS